jgi:hypothetical protein
MNNTGNAVTITRNKIVELIKVRTASVLKWRGIMFAVLKK